MIGPLLLMALVGIVGLTSWSERVTDVTSAGSRPAPTLVTSVTHVTSVTRSVSTPVPTPLATTIPRRPIVAIDPGHGGPDDDLPRADRAGRVIPWYREGDNSGAIYRWSDGNELREKDLTLRLALATADHLRERDVVVVLTRRGDVPVNLEKRDYNDDGQVNLTDELLARIDLVNRGAADLLVSIHLNANPSPAMRGISANYASGRPFSERSVQLALAIHSQVLRGLRALPVTVVDRGVEDDASDDPLGRHLLLLGPRTERAPLETAMPGALIEPLFLTNLDDAQVLQRADVLDTIARSIADGILEYLAEG